MKKWLIILLIAIIVFVTFLILSLFSLDVLFSDAGFKKGVSLRYSPSLLWRIFVCS
jgi:hypothetical protein